MSLIWVSLYQLLCNSQSPLRTHALQNEQVMHYRVCICSFLVVAFASLVNTEIVQRRVPYEDAVLGNLEGLPPCYVSVVYPFDSMKR